MGLPRGLGGGKSGLRALTPPYQMARPPADAFQSLERYAIKATYGLRVAPRERAAKPLACGAEAVANQFWVFSAFF